MNFALNDIKKILEIIRQWKSFYIIGTSTSIGKTYIGNKILEFSLLQNYKLHALKPVETGMSISDLHSDSYSYLNIYQHFKWEKSIKDINRYHFKEAVSPHLSSVLENQEFEMSKIVEFINQYDISLIELAGGLFVPLNTQFTQFDLLKISPKPCLVVAGSKLGTLNHLLLTLHALKSIRINDILVVLNRFDTNEFIDRENFKYISDRYPTLCISNFG